MHSKLQISVLIGNAVVVKIVCYQLMPYTLIRVVLWDMFISTTRKLTIQRTTCTF